MKSLFLMLVAGGCLCAVTARSAEVDITVCPTQRGYTLVWQDEFEGTTLDPGKWTHRRLGPRRGGVTVADAVALDAQGHLIVTTYSHPTEFDAAGQPTAYQHRTGMVATEGLAEWTDGYFEARLRFEGTAGNWFSFWMQSPGISSGLTPPLAGVEYDIIEHRVVSGAGKPIDALYRIANHWGGYEAPHHRKAEFHFLYPPLREAFVVVGLERSPQGCRFYVDGQLVWSPTPEELPVSEVRQFLVLSGEVEDRDWAGAVPRGGYGDRIASQTRMIVDYVRVYERKESAQ